MTHIHTDPYTNPWDAHDVQATADADALREALLQDPDWLPESPDPEQVIADAQAVADALNDALLTALEGLTFERAAGQLRALRKARTLLQQLENTYERHIGTVGPYGDSEVPGVGLVHVRRGKERKHWDHENVAGAVLEAHLSRADGEVPDPWTVRDWLLAAAAPQYWRVGVLRDLGIDPDEYAEVVRGRLTVQIDSPDEG